jgi:hypothetical protein
MQEPPSLNSAAEPTSARLYLDGAHVGDIVAQGSSGGWIFGTFSPNRAFAPFARYFGRWSRLLHTDATGERLADDASAALRKAEYDLDALHARLFIPLRNEWHSAIQVNIDGPLIEWKQY